MDENNLCEPMNYIFPPNSSEKDNIQIEDVIEYFAEYTNLNNLGLIGDAHLALADRDSQGAKGLIPMKIAIKYAHAVDAPKTGEKIVLSKDEEPIEFPHYMGKPKQKSYKSETILGKLYDEINEIIDKTKKKKEVITEFYDKDLEKSGYEKFAILGLVFYRDFFEDLLNLLKKNEIKSESVLLTGKNTNNEESMFSRRKKNDFRKKISYEMRRIFREARNNFSQAIKNFFIYKNKEIPLLKDLNDELFFKNNLHLFASACYMMSYNFYEISSQEKYIDSFGKYFYEFINKYLYKDNEIEELNDISEEECEMLGVDLYSCQESNIEYYNDRLNNKKKWIKKIIESYVEDMKGFIRVSKSFKTPKNANEENQYRILSFPWCYAGKLLSSMKFLNNI